MAYQNDESSITLHLVKRIKYIHNNKPSWVKEFTFGNPYKVTVYEQDGVCYLVAPGLGNFPIKETMEEVCKMLEKLKENFDKEFEEWYNRLPADPELRRLATGM